MTKIMSGKTFGNVGLSNFQTFNPPPPPPPPILFETGYSRTRGKRQNGFRTHLLVLFCKMDIQRTETCGIAMCYSLMLLYWCDWSFAYCVTSLKGVEYCPQTMSYTKWGKGGVGDYLFFVFLPWSLGSLALNSNLNWLHSFILWTSSYFNLSVFT